MVNQSEVDTIVSYRYWYKMKSKILRAMRQETIAMAKFHIEYNRLVKQKIRLSGERSSVGCVNKLLLEWISENMEKIEEEFKRRRAFLKVLRGQLRIASEKASEFDDSY